MRKISYILIVLGIGIALYPKLAGWYSDYRQEKLLEEIERKEAGHGQPFNSDQAGLVSGFIQMSRLLEEIDEEPEQHETQSADTQDIDDETGIGTIIIDAIDLKLPILEGATKQNLKHAAAHMSETAPIGQTGNAAIAAHRSRTTGKLFNRLDEVDVGDEIIVRSQGQKYVYSVYDITVVKPTDVSVLESDGLDSILTLITCEPLVNPTHRLIVHAKQESTDSTR
ncbi:class D sortase [Paenibacillus fonticola]|uniref:class D sortase n=1 Tax=Paenibacillus fonticola TaxID=379896 RepID=UPI000372385E|nr:class D sortase [Paenibacillus fonticola]